MACGCRSDILALLHQDVWLYYPIAISTCCSRPTIAYRYWDTFLIPDASNNVHSVLTCQRHSLRSNVYNTLAQAAKLNFSADRKRIIMTLTFRQRQHLNKPVASESFSVSVVIFFSAGVINSNLRTILSHYRFEKKLC